jgi:hypothetical protein
VEGARLANGRQAIDDLHAALATDGGLTAAIVPRDLHNVLLVIADELAAIRSKIDQPAIGWMGIDAASRYVGLTTKALRHEAQSGRLRTHRTASGRLRWRARDLDAWAQAGNRP